MKTARACCRPDELVRPTFHLPSARIEQPVLRSRVLRLLCAMLIYLLDYLKRQNDIYNLVRLPVPDPVPPRACHQAGTSPAADSRFHKSDYFLLPLPGQSVHQSKFP